MECSCTASSYNDGDGSWSMRKRKAAKIHMCYECDTVIQKGEEYAFHSVFYENGISNYKLCANCNALTEVFFSDGWIFGSVIDDLHSFLDHNWKEDLPSSCISKLPQSARDKVCDYLQGYQEE